MKPRPDPDPPIAGLPPDEAHTAIRQGRYQAYVESIERRISHVLIEREACLLG